jgi:hypothetical protein
VKRLALCGALLLAACRGEAPATDANVRLDRLVDSLIPSVERATGLTFKRPPRAEMVTREQAGAYLREQLAKQYPRERAGRLTTSYRLLGLLPDTLDLEKLLLSVLTEQVAGYYDPDSNAFFGVDGADPLAFRVTVAHELVHALQDDHLPLDSILDDQSDADRQVAAQAMLEGQATLAMIRMQPEVGDQVLEGAFWDQFRAGVRDRQTSMPQFAGAPRVLQEALIFPYVDGAAFVRWWVMNHPADQQPYGASLPRSTEEILAPERAARGDARLYVTFVGADSAVHADALGAMETRVLLASARGQAELDDPAILGWGGDRFELYDTPAGEALVWIAVFDTRASRDRAAAALAKWPAPRAAYRTDLAELEVSGKGGLRLTIAPAGWTRWSSLPTATAKP